MRRRPEAAMEHYLNWFQALASAWGFMLLVGLVCCCLSTQSRQHGDGSGACSCDGGYAAYRERGVPKAKSNCKIIIVHGFGSSKDMNFQVPQELIEELGIYFLLYDRAGYGESDLNPRRSVKSEALDLQELVDQLRIGPKFYVIGVSMGGWVVDGRQG
ncbi:hypothetical protein V6N13_097024 [Hibiscus sabdariffa]